jgi:acyl-CoA thioester hydrolase
MAAANGHFVHVFVERAQDKAVPIPDSIRTALEKIRADG